MKTLTTMLVASAFVSGLMAQSTSNREMDNWHMAKYGRPSPVTEARLREDQANTAYRADTTSPVPTPWTELYFQAKYGRSSPAEEARLKAERDSTAYRAEPYHSEPAKTWQDHWFKAKYGRDRL